jgi:hypothetical protein
MTDFVLVAAQLPTPIKVAWALWILWIVAQVALYRWMRQEAPAPALLQPSQPPQDVVAARSRRRRRRRRPAEAHEPGALQEIGA